MSSFPWNFLLFVCIYHKSNILFFFSFHVLTLVEEPSILVTWSRALLFLLFFFVWPLLFLSGQTYLFDPDLCSLVLHVNWFVWRQSYCQWAVLIWILREDQDVTSLFQNFLFCFIFYSKSSSKFIFQSHISLFSTLFPNCISMDPYFFLSIGH